MSLHDELDDEGFVKLAEFLPKVNSDLNNLYQDI